MVLWVGAQRKLSAARTVFDVDRVADRVEPAAREVVDRLQSLRDFLEHPAAVLEDALVGPGAHGLTDEEVVGGFVVGFGDAFKEDPRRAPFDEVDVVGQALNVLQEADAALVDLFGFVVLRDGTEEERLGRD